MAGWFARGRTSLVGRLIGTFLGQSRTIAGILVWIGLGVVLTILVLALLAPFIAPFDPNTKVASPELPPGGAFLMGTDRGGQDVLSRIIWGSRVPLAIIAVSTTISLALGLPLGLVSGFAGGRMDRGILLVMDSIYACLGLLLAIAIAAVIGRGGLNISLATPRVFSPTYFRVIRNHVTSLKHQPYVGCAAPPRIPPRRGIGPYT